MLWNSYLNLKKIMTKKEKVKSNIKNILCVLLGFIIFYIPIVLSYWASSRSLINHKFILIDKVIKMEWFIYDLNQHIEVLILRIFILFLIHKLVNYKALNVLAIVYILDTIYDIVNYVLTFQTFTSIPVNILIFITYVYVIIKLTYDYVQEIT